MNLQSASTGEDCYRFLAYCRTANLSPEEVKQSMREDRQTQLYGCGWWLWVQSMWRKYGDEVDSSSSPYRAKSRAEHEAFDAWLEGEVLKVQKIAATDRNDA